MRQTKELMALQQRVEEWRRKDGAGRGSRIPEEIWNEAVNITRTAGLYPTARALRFNYEKLKHLAAGKVSRPKKHATEFVTLQMPPQQPNEIKVVIDLAGQDGEQVRIDVSCGSAMDGLCRVCREVLSSEPMSGIVFVFRSKRGTAIRELAYDGRGLWLCHLRLSQGEFRYWPGRKGETRCEVLAHQLQVLLAGGDPDATRAAPIWRPIATAGAL